MSETSFDALAVVVASLDTAGIPHMLAGSFASSHHGIPRTTADIDLVIDPDESSLDRFIELLDGERWYVPKVSMARALRERDQFNMIDTHSGWKIDLVIRKDRPFSESEFRRRQRVSIAGVEVAVASAEDTVLAKLEWAAATDSERQLRDVVDLLCTVGNRLDGVYLDRWAAELGVEVALQRARNVADGVDPSG